MSKRRLSQDEIDCLLHGDDLREQRIRQIRQFGKQAEGLTSLLQPTPEPAPAPSAACDGPSEDAVIDREFVTRTAAALKQAIAGLIRSECRVAVDAVRDAGQAPVTAFCVERQESGLAFPLGIEAGLLFPLIRRILGGEWGAGAPPCRPLTEIEQRFALRIARHIAAGLQQSWMDSTDPPWDVKSLEQPSLGSAADDGTLVPLPFQITAAEVTGGVRLLVPAQFLATVCRHWQIQDLQPEPASGQSVRLAVNLLQADVPAEPIDELAVGDIISTDHGPDALLDVTLNGLPLLQGRLGSSGGNKAIRLV